jgi:hypothetical protein
MESKVNVAHALVRAALTLVSAPNSQPNINSP